MANSITFDRVQDEQRLEGDAVNLYVTATIRIDGKGPFFYRALKTDQWAAEMRAWAEAQAVQLRTMIGS